VSLSVRRIRRRDARKIAKLADVLALLVRT
jgi:hypothetical protein